MERLITEAARNPAFCLALVRPALPSRHAHRAAFRGRADTTSCRIVASIRSRLSRRFGVHDRPVREAQTIFQRHMNRYQRARSRPCLPRSLPRSRRPGHPRQRSVPTRQAIRASGCAVAVVPPRTLTGKPKHIAGDPTARVQSRRSTQALPAFLAVLGLLAVWLSVAALTLCSLSRFC